MFAFWKALAKNLGLKKTHTSQPRDRIRISVRLVRAIRNTKPGWSTTVPALAHNSWFAVSWRNLIADTKSTKSFGRHRILPGRKREFLGRLRPKIQVDPLRPNRWKPAKPLLRPEKTRRTWKNPSPHPFGHVTKILGGPNKFECIFKIYQKLRWIPERRGSGFRVYRTEMCC